MGSPLKCPLDSHGLFLFGYCELLQERACMKSESGVAH
jgi:hypothetical protein